LHRPLTWTLTSCQCSWLWSLTCGQPTGRHCAGTARLLTLVAGEYPHDAIAPLVATVLRCVRDPDSSVRATLIDTTLTTVGGAQSPPAVLGRLPMRCSTSETSARNWPPPSPRMQSSRPPSPPMTHGILIDLRLSNFPYMSDSAEGSPPSSERMPREVEGWASSGSTKELWRLACGGEAGCTRCHRRRQMVTHRR
jgi:hypothetical protein